MAAPQQASKAAAVTKRVVIFMVMAFSKERATDDPIAQAATLPAAKHRPVKRR